jgi:Domain of unknown function (DUF4382)/Domain of unknown function (DUF5666)
MTHLHLLSALPACALLSFLSACGGSSSSPTADADFLVTDAPTDELLSFSARVTELRLRNSTGGESGNYLPAPVTLEFLGLQGVSAWLSSSAVPVGNYDAVLLRFDPSSINAKALNGDSVSVTSGSNQLTASLSSPLQVDEGGYVRFEADLDLNSSLSGEVSSGSLIFNPTGSCSVGGQSSTAIDEFKGVVQSFDSVNQTLLMQAYVDDDLIVPLGPVTVTVDGSTALFNDDNQAFASTAAFFSYLVTGSTLLEVHGNLSADGQVIATKIEVEDQVGGISGGNTLVRIEGIVTDLDEGSFELLIQEIVKGAAVAQPVLNKIGNPSTITVSYDQSTVFKFDSEALTTSASLSIGQEVKAKFATFSSEPFPAFEVEIDDSPSLLQGTVRDLGAYPSAILIELSPQAAGILAPGQGPAENLLSLELPEGAVPTEVHLGQAVRFGSRSGAEVDPNGGRHLSATRFESLPASLLGVEVIALEFGSRTLTTLGGTFNLGLESGGLIGPTAVALDPDGELWARQENGQLLPLSWQDLGLGDQLDLEVRPGSSKGEWTAQRMIRR